MGEGSTLLHHWRSGIGGLESPEVGCYGCWAIRREKTMKVSADTQKCCSSGMCVVRAPEIFGQDEANGLVKVLQAFPPESLRKAAKDAADGCPVQAIRIEDLTTPGA
jgi:ferredoxin